VSHFFYIDKPYHHPSTYLAMSYEKWKSSSVKKVRHG
jgi:hypothetical protein